MEENIIKEEESNNKDLYQCKECGFHYKNKHTVEKCEAWCKEHKTCNVEITKEAEENKKDTSSNELKELKKKSEEYLNNWKRSAADFINYKKEEMERMGMLAKYAKEDMVLKFLPILDNIYLATRQNFPSENLSGQEDKSLKSFYDGLMQIQKQAEEFLKKEGIEEIKTVGEKFDPNTMEIIEEVDLPAGEAGGSESGTVAAELQKGYMVDGKVLRPAKVKVLK